MTIRFVLKDPTASVRTRQSLNTLATNLIETIISRVGAVTASLNLSLTSGVADYTVTVTGAKVGDIVVVSPATLPAISVASWVGVVTAANTVTVRILISGGPGGFSVQSFLVTVLGV